MMTLLVGILFFAGVTAGVLVWWGFQEYRRRKRKDYLQKRIKQLEGRLAHSKNLVLFDPTEQKIDILEDATIDMSKITAKQDEEAVEYEWKPQETPVNYLIGEGRNKLLWAGKQEDTLIPLLDLEQIQNIQDGTSLFKELQKFQEKVTLNNFEREAESMQEITMTNEEIKRKEEKSIKYYGFRCSSDLDLLATFLKGFGEGRGKIIEKEQFLRNIEEFLGRL